MFMNDSPALDLSRESFLESLRLSHIFTEDRYQKILHDLPKSCVSASACAQHWVHAGLLTPYQAARLLAGRTDGYVLGQYVVLAYLGHCAMGRLYQARHRSMNRLVCLQVLSSSMTRSAEAREAIHREARTTAQLVHPNIVTLLDVNQLRDRTYFVTEYVDGASCEAILKQTGRFGWRMACEILAQAAEGLLCAHERGIAHGRINSEAILVSRMGAQSTNGKPPVKLHGFGLSKIPIPADESGRLLPFRAPELARANSGNELPADVFALGVVFYELLTATLPGPAIRVLRPDLPELVAAFLESMLAALPQSRPTAAEVAQRFHALGHTDDTGFIDFSLNPSGMIGSGPLSFTNPRSGTHLSDSAMPLPEDAIFESPQEIPGPRDQTLATLDALDRTPVMLKSTRGRATKKKPKRRGSAIHPMIVFLLMLAVASLTLLALMWMLKQFGG